MLECKICGTKFNAIIEKHYLARDNGKTGLAVAFGSTAEECLYDAFDCPMCGCQVIAKERKRRAAAARRSGLYFSHGKASALPPAPPKP